MPCFEELAKKHAGDFEMFQIPEVGFNQQMYLLEIVEGVVAGMQPNLGLNQCVVGGIQRLK